MSTLNPGGRTSGEPTSGCRFAFALACPLVRLLIKLLKRSASGAPTFFRFDKAARRGDAVGSRWLRLCGRRLILY
ncbi:hypothetical protein scyTo_0002630 [Scyliorhinus torazame]|uniref:Uncharacterized protein n=1 Tax=Scyliorhinus torazame TaxID=75743 RepID=A0A401PKC3_SCYTO|nr:hypothetical protein [Scyliorhinus torazame]